MASDIDILGRPENLLSSRQRARRRLVLHRLRHTPPSKIPRLPLRGAAGLLGLRLSAVRQLVDEGLLQVGADGLVHLADLMRGEDAEV